MFVLLHAQMVTSLTQNRAPIHSDITKSERNNKRLNMNFDEIKLEQGSDSGPLQLTALHVSHPGEAAVCTNMSSRFLTYKCCPLVEPHRVQAASKEALAD